MSPDSPADRAAAEKQASVVPTPPSTVTGIAQSPRTPGPASEARRRRQRQSAALWLLLGGHLLIFIYFDLTAEVWLRWKERSMVLLLVQGSICMTCMGLGPGPPHWRIAWGTAALGCLGLLEPQSWILEQRMAVLTWMAAIFLPCLLLIRRAEYRIVRTPGTPSLPGIRYSLRSLLLLTTAAAVAAASAVPARAIIGRQYRSGDFAVLMNAIWLMIVVALILGGLWVWLRPGNPLGRLAAYLIGAVGAAGFCIYTLPAPLNPYRIVGIPAGVAILGGVTWGLLRLAGYRLLSLKERSPAPSVATKGS